MSIGERHAFIKYWKKNYRNFVKGKIIQESNNVIYMELSNKILKNLNV